MKFFGVLAAFGLLINQSFQAAGVECGEGKVLAAGNTTCIQPDFIEGCEVYADVSSCGTCKKAYTLKNRKCDYIGGYQNGAAIPGCLATDASNKCTNCANGFKRVGGSCKLTTKNCAKYGNNDECLDCENDYSLVLGRCRHNFLLGCRVETEDHSCKECFAPYSSNGNHCDIPHCQSFNDFGCVGCQCGYYLAADRTCKQVTAGCIRYYRGMCVNCLPHYKLKGGSCQIDGCLSYQGNSCEKCSENFKLTAEGGCQFENCQDWNNGVCLVCKKGFKRENDGCSKVDQKELSCM